MTDTTLTIGMIGCGFIGKVHSFAYLNLPMYYDPPPANIRLKAVCTAHRETAEAAAERFGYEVATTDYREITEDPEIDVVNICTPNREHKGQLLAAIRSGKHIYCDKPLTANADEAGQALAQLDGYDGTHQVTFHNRFFPATLKARDLAANGFLGRVLTFRAAYLHAGSVDPDRAFGWRFSKGISGGGALYDLGSHIIDLVRHLVGEFAEVSCSTTIAYPARPAPGDPSKRIVVDADDAAFMLVRTVSGSLGSIESSRLSSGTQDELRFEIHGNKGAMRFNLMAPNWLDICDLTSGRSGWTRLPTVQNYPNSGGFLPGKASIGWVRAHIACLHNFVASAVRGEPAEPGIEVGARIQQIMDAGYRSAESGSWVTV